MERKLVIDGFSILKYLPFYDKSSPSIALLDRMTRDREKSHAAAFWHQNGNNVVLASKWKQRRNSHIFKENTLLGIQCIV